MTKVEILPWPINAKCSKAETRVARALQDSDLGPDWIVLHSLNLADGSTRKKWCEGDFVIIGPPGILVIEVKGGRIAKTNGLWSSIDESDKKYQIQDPLEQAKIVAFGIQKEVSNIHPHLKSILSRTAIGFAVSFPDVNWTLRLIDLPEVLVADRPNVISNTIGRFVRHALTYWVKKLGDRVAPLSADDREALLQALRPDFDLFQSLAATGERVMETQVRATEEQYRHLDMVSRSPRVCFEGGAGTGKSFVALEACRRLAREGKSVAMIVRSKPLATSFARELNGVSARVLTSDAIETHTDVYDALIVDEGQDLLQHATLDALNRIVRDGLEGGRWYWFMDVNRQLMPGISLDKECLERILRIGGHNGAAFILTNNCRNAPEVRENAVLSTGFDIGTCSQLGGGGRVDILTANDQSEALVKLADWLQKLRTDGFSTSDIALLTTGHPEWLLKAMKFTGYEKPFCLDDEVNRDVRRDPAVCCSSIAAFKGLERPCIAVVVPNVVDATVDTSELYVALTRARVVCAVIASPALLLRLKTSAARVADMNPEFFEG